MLKPAQRNHVLHFREDLEKEKEEKEYEDEEQEQEEQEQEEQEQEAAVGVAAEEAAPAAVTSLECSVEVAKGGKEDKKQGRERERVGERKSKK